jgi:hypothetical protein
MFDVRIKVERLFQFASCQFVMRIRIWKNNIVAVKDFLPAIHSEQIFVKLCHMFDEYIEVKSLQITLLHLVIITYCKLQTSLETLCE